MRQSRPASATLAESGAYLLDSSRVPRRRQFIDFKPPYAIGSVPSLSGHAIAYRCHLLPRVRRHRASKPQGSSKRVLPWQVTINQLICAYLSHTHYWYEGGMLKAFWYDYRTLQRAPEDFPDISSQVSRKTEHFSTFRASASFHVLLAYHEELLSLQPMFPPKSFTF